jgi:hypothetical protein
MRRWCLTLIYVLGTVAAQFGHDDHGHAAHDRAPEALASCLDGGLHLADHPDAPDLDRDHASCAVCSLRSAPILTSATAQIDRPDIAASQDPSPTPVAAHFEHPARSARGPPQV